MIEPKLRFKADDGSQFPDWEEKVFGDFVDTHLEKTSDKDTYPLYSLTIESGVQPKTDRYEREFLVKKEGDNYKIVPPNAFVYNPMNLRFGALKVNHEKFSVSVSGYYDVFSLKDDSVLAFWENYLVTPKMLNYYFSIATGSLIEKLRVHYSQFVKIKKPLPSLPEQQKIAEFLSTIDTVIAKQKETVSAWEERKKGVMQKLFSQEVRFKADDGSDFPEWEEKSYLSICNVFADGDWIESKDQSDSGIRLIQTGNIGNGVFIDKDDKKKYISKETFDRLKCNEVFEGDILISRLPSPAGRACIVPKLNERMITAVDCTIVRTDKSIILHDYCVQFMQSPKHFYYVASMMAGGTRQRISRKNLEDELISVPCLEEQQKIADCLSALDDVIEKQKATLAAWEELKKGLLQQMFV